MKLKSKFILWFTAFALIPVITVGTFVYVGTKKVSEKSAMDTVINEQAFAMQSIQNIIMMIESAGNQASNDKQVIEFLQNSSAGTITPEEQKQLNDKLGNMVSGFAVYENIMVLNSNGKCVADGDYASSKTGQDLSGLKAYTQVKSDGVEYISKVEKSQYSANPILTLSFPIKQQNTQIGVLVQTIDLQKLSVKYIGNIKLVNKGMLFVMEADGTTIMHPDNKEILTQNIANTAGGKEIVKKKKGDSNYVYKNKMTAVYKTDSRLGWIFVAAFPTKEINLVGDKIVSTISMVGLFALIGSLILSTLIGSAISKKIVKIAKDMDHVAEGDFTTIFNTIGRDEIAHMSGQINTTLSKIRDSITHVKDAANSMGEMSTTLSLNSEQMASTTNEVATAIQDVASGASNQADDLMEVVNVVADFSKELESIHDKLELVRDLTTQTEDKAGFGSKQLDELKASIMQIQNSFKLVQNKVDGLANTVSKIGSITDVINGISRETDLLALNAAIEAARAGDAGRGFAVVAEEVRKLSEESRRSSEEIITLVQLITKEMLDVTRTSKVMDNQLENQVGTIENTISAVGDILNAIADTAPIIMDTYNSVEKANNSKTVIMDKVEAVSAVSQEVSASAEEIAASSEEMLASAEEVNRFSIELSAAAESLVEKVNVFKI